MRARLARGERQAADAVPVRKPWVGGASVRGQTCEPAFQHLPAALLDQRAGVPENELRHAVVVAARAQELGRGLELPIGLRERGRLLAQRAKLHTGKSNSGAAQQEVAKQRVVFVGGLGLRAPQGEVVLAMQLFEQLARGRHRGELRHHRRAHLRQQRAHQQHVAGLRVQPGKDLGGEMVEQHLRVAVGRCLRRAPRPAVLQQQHQARRPARSAAVQLALAQPLDALHLLERELQLFPAELLERRACRELAGRAGTAQHDGAETGRQRVHPLAHQRVQRGAGRHFLVIVEHQHERRLELGGERLEVAARENAQPGEIFRGEVRQRCARVRRRRARCKTEVVEKRARVVVARVDLVPQVRKLAIDEVAARQRGLARPRRGADPGQAMLALVEPLEQALAQEHVAVARARDLGEESARRGRRFGHRRILQKAVGKYLPGVHGFTPKREKAKMAATCFGGAPWP